MKVYLSLFRKNESSPCEAEEIELSAEEITLLLNSKLVQFPFETSDSVNFEVIDSRFNIKEKFCVIYLRAIQ